MQDIDNPIGRLDSVSGSRVSGLLDGGGDAAPAGGVGIGGLVRVRTPASTVFGAVNNLTTRYPSASGEAPRTAVDIDLIGEILDDPGGGGGGGQGFQRGVSFYPSIGAAFAAASAEDVAAVYGRPDGSNVRIGTVHQDADLPAHLRTDDLLGKHFAVLGTTGSGKSCSVALILRAILTQHAAGHVILLDPHNEYGNGFADLAEIVTTADLQLPYWLLTFEEMVEVMVSKEGVDRQAEIAILKEAIVQTKKAMVGDDKESGHITVDTPVPFRLGEFRRYIDNAMGRLDKPEGAAPYLRLLARLESLNSDKRFAFMFSSLVVRDNMVDLLSRMLRIPVAGKPITIIDLSGVPSEIVDVVVSVLCRMVFDFALWSVQEKTVPVLLVCEEAHRYVPERDDQGFRPTKQSISRIAKEGRKYGVSVCLVSQRPSELSASILSQCGTLFALRMGNEQDQDFVRRALPENAHGLLDVLPALRTQEAVVVGEGVAVPMRIRFDVLDEAHQPRSGAAPFSEVWQADTEQQAYIEETVERWRWQRR
jgi:hypothetical protein